MRNKVQKIKRVLANRFRSLATYIKANRAAKYSAVVLFAVVGLITLRLASAAPDTLSFEAENSENISAGVSVVQDNSASAGEAIRFETQAEQDTSLSNFFPIGTFVSPASDFTKWKNRGINTLVEPPQGTTPGPWAEQAKAQGLKVIAPVGAGSASNVLAWNHPDEPDGIFSQIPYTKIQQDYNTWKSQNADMPVYINFIGALNQYDLKTNEGGPEWYKKYMAGADWISADTYPVNEGKNLNIVGNMIDKLRSWSNNKPVFAFIESSDYNTTNAHPGPNPAQVRAQIWSSIIHGVRGYWFFAPRVTPSFAFDATPNDVAAEITKQNNIVTSLTDVLQSGAINPSSLSANVPSGLEAGWRNHSTGKYFFVLNLSNTTKNNQTITLNGIGSATTASVYREDRSVAVSNGQLTDNFAPYQVHIYQVR